MLVQELIFSSFDYARDDKKSVSRINSYVKILILDTSRYSIGTLELTAFCQNAQQVTLLYLQCNRALTAVHEIIRDALLHDHDYLLK